MPRYIRTNQAADVGANAENTTEVIDGVTYEVIEFGSDFEQNKSKLGTAEDGNYRYVLTADFDMRWLEDSIYDRRLGLQGASVILDLNGQTLTTDGWSHYGAYSYLILYCTNFELTDSSAAQNGTIVSESLTFHDSTNCKSMVVSGGNGTLIFSGSGSHKSTTVTINGGNYSCYFNPNMMTAATLIAPYVQVGYNAAGELIRIRSHYHYAVSISNLVVGMHNTAYGYQWEITAKTLSGLTMPTDKTYYLWGRNKDGGYKYLNLRYDSDQKTWVAA